MDKIKKRMSTPPDTTSLRRTAFNETVFLSYSRVDREYVSNLVRWFKGHGVTVWYDHEIDYGKQWRSEILKRLDEASALLVVMSKAARRSRWVLREIDRAKKRTIPVLPLLLETDGIIKQVADLQFENVTGGKLPSLRFCQKLPGFLVNEKGILEALTKEQRDIASRIFVATGGRGLSQGSKGPAVAALQIELLRVGLDPGPIDGEFGKATQKALIEFQRRRSNVPNADGMIGPITWAILTNSSLGDLAPSATADKLT